MCREPDSLFRSMASLWKHPNSRYWTACWTDESGRRMKRSTKTTNRREALKAAEAMEAATRRKIALGKGIGMLREIFGEDDKAPVTVRGYALAWLEEMRPSVSGSTYSAYRTGLTHWLSCMGGRADAPLLHLSRRDIEQYRRTLADGHPVTGNQRLKLVKMVLKAARDAGHSFDDPFTGLKMFREAKDESAGRRPFTVAELQKLLAAADGEWRSLILFGLYTGQRLGDIAALRWNQVDMARGEITLTTKKTGRRMAIPINTALAEHLAAMTAGDDPKAFLHPRAKELVAGAKGKVSTLSRHFGQLLESAGLRAVETVATGKSAHDARGIGRGGRRTLAELSFHSLRHTARSLLEAAGVPLKTAMDLLGHSDTGSSLGYTHVDSETLRRAAESLPRL